MSAAIEHSAPTLSVLAPDGLPPVASALGDVLRAMRQERGWSQLRLAAEAGVDQRCVQWTERGKQRPLYATWVKIADALLLQGVARDRFLAHVSVAPCVRTASGRFGRLLRQYRLRAGYSQNALAQATGCNATWVNRLEADERNTTAPFVHTVSSALSLTTEETDSLLLAAGLVPSWAGDRTVRQLARLLAGDAVLAAAVRVQISALFRMVREGDDA